MPTADSLEETLMLGKEKRAVEDEMVAGRDWGQEEKGTTEDEMAGWHH